MAEAVRLDDLTQEIQETTITRKLSMIQEEVHLGRKDIRVFTSVTRQQQNDTDHRE